MIKRVVAARELQTGHVLAESDIDFRIPAAAKITPNALPPVRGSDSSSASAERWSDDIGFEEIADRADVGID